VGENLPIVLIEVVLIFGGVLAFAWWQLHEIKVDQRKAAAERAERAEREAREARERQEPAAASAATAGPASPDNTPAPTDAH
jgi:predicted negative regulator of RcsB-dependent stress response